jgi:hypothetical protein
LPEKPFAPQKGHVYGGSVRENAGENSTYLAVKMTPSSQCSEEQEKACNRRLMLRLQVLADKARQTQPEPSNWNLYFFDITPLFQACLAM